MIFIFFSAVLLIPFLKSQYHKFVVQIWIRNNWKKRRLHLTLWKKSEKSFLFDHGREGNVDDEVAGSPIRRQNLGQGKTIAYGREHLLKSASKDSDIDEMPMGSSASGVKESVATKMMKKVGYVEGEGLGVHGQGRVAPVETIKHDHRLGLGHHYQSSVNLTSSSSVPLVVDERLFASFDPPISVPSDVSSSTTSNPCTRNEKNTIEERIQQHQWIEQESLLAINWNIWWKMQPTVPYMAIMWITERHFGWPPWTNSFICVNWSLCRGETTVICNSSRHRSICPILLHLHLLLMMVQGPGCAEYLVWQQEKQVTGTIISHRLFPSPFGSSVVIKSTTDENHPRVHLYFCDINILPSRVKLNTRYTEQSTKRRFLLACRHALTKLKEGGQFVCQKLTDTFTRSTASLIYLLYRSFKSVTILRPFALDPRTPTRFLVCQALKYSVNASIIQHLSNLTKYDRPESILAVVPLKCLLEGEFQQYLADTSQRLLQREIQALAKCLYYLEEKNNSQVYFTSRLKHFPLVWSSRIV